jgi:hypothetical protein
VKNCRYYGHAMYFGLLMPNPGSNQCALITTAHSPCYLEIEGKPVEWSACRYNTGDSHAVN